MISIAEYDYPLTDERIAKFPLPQRDSSKLLVYRQGAIADFGFRDISEQLPSGAFLVVNNTKVLPARLYFQNANGAAIELLLLEPADGFEVTQVMSRTEPCVWHCMIGNKKRFKDSLAAEFTIAGVPFVLTAQWHNRDENQVHLSWGSQNPTTLFPTFSEVVEALGQMPLPPYLNREAQESDKQTYQTVYASQQGAVAAPTAGLHFTPEIMATLAAKGIQTAEVTLHVGAGTFLPVKTEDALEHPMHAEQLVVSKEFIRQLAANLDQVIPVGTTSMRTLETLYWVGVKLHETGKLADNHTFYIEKLFPYQERSESIAAHTALETVLNYLEHHQLTHLIGETQIMIFPGYEFKICRGIITNFHQPKSTLLLLISALIGSNWRRVYDHALANGYRFLSYGDSSLLLP